VPSGASDAENAPSAGSVPNPLGAAVSGASSDSASADSDSGVLGPVLGPLLNPLLAKSSDGDDPLSGNAPATGEDDESDAATATTSGSDDFFGFANMVGDAASAARTAMGAAPRPTSAQAIPQAAEAAARAARVVAGRAAPRLMVCAPAPPDYAGTNGFGGNGGYMTTGGSDSPARGIMLQAVQGGADDPVPFEWVTLDSWDLDIQVPVDAMKCAVDDTPHVRAPVTYRELVQICAQRGLVPPTTDIVDAIYAAAAIHTHPIGLVRTAQDSLSMANVSFVLKHHANVEADIAAAVQNGASGLIEPVGKWFIVDARGFQSSKYGDQAAIIYGWQDPSGTPIQPLSWIHNCDHTDYSQVCRAICRYARRHSVWVNEQRTEQVDLLDEYGKRWPQMQRWLAPLAG